MRKTIFYNSDPVAISSKMNEYMKSNFGYEVDGDLESLREAKAQLEAQKREMTADHQDRAYVENMLMIETIKSLLKAHVAEGELPPGLKAYQDAKKKGESPKKSKAKSDKMPMDAGKDGKMGTKDDKPAFLKKDESLSEYTNENAMQAVCKDCGDTFGKPTTDCKNDCNDPTLDCWVKESSYMKEGKSPHKKGTKKYKAHMAAMHAEGKERTDEVLPLVPLVGMAARAVGGAVAKKVGSKVAGAAANVATRAVAAKALGGNKNESDAPKVNTQDEFSNTFKGQKEYKMSTQKIQENLLAELNTLLESDAAEAEVLMAARGMVDELQDMIEKLGKLQNDQLGPLSDEMAYSHGADRATAFKESVNDAISGLLGQARSTKDTVNDAVLVLNGEKPSNDMASDIEIGGDMQDDFEDDVELDGDAFAGGDEAASGPDDEPLGRTKRT
ncbi:hypothetical protein N9E09_00265 [bacterium]|nr:hypothetical protein [bacterium]